MARRLPRWPVVTVTPPVRVAIAAAPLAQRLAWLAAGPARRRRPRPLRRRLSRRLRREPAATIAASTRRTARGRPHGGPLRRCADSVVAPASAGERRRSSRHAWRRAEQRIPVAGRRRGCVWRCRAVGVGAGMRHCERRPPGPWLTRTCPKPQYKADAGRPSRSLTCAAQPSARSSGRIRVEASRSRGDCGTGASGRGGSRRSSDDAMSPRRVKVATGRPSRR